MSNWTGDGDRLRQSPTTPPQSEIGVLRQAFREGTLSPVEVVKEALDRAEKSQSSINAFTEICRETAIDAAKACEAAFASGEVTGELAGIPITVKDILTTKGIRTTMGSMDLAHHVPNADATSVERLRKSGAIIIGKTTTPEFACKQTTNSQLSGMTRNPWNLDLTPGGSSGGSSASLACGIGSVSLVTDGGGSARLPAACTGVVGFKPTFGLVPFDSAPDVFSGLGHIGLMARGVEDIAEALLVVAGPHRSDASSLARNLSGRTLKNNVRPLEGVRVGWRERLNDEAIGKAILPAVLSALNILEGLGATIEPVVGSVEPPLPIWQTLQHAIWAERHAHRLTPTAKIDPVISSGIRSAETLSARDLQRALHGRTQLFRQFQSWFDQFDIVVTPTLARMPLSADHPGAGDIDIDGENAGDIRAAWAPMLGMFTVTGHPALSLNCGWTDDGLPIGVQLVGPWYSDLFLLDVARELQNNNPGASWRMPNLPLGSDKSVNGDDHAH
jgi:aspartyl-tRNA(Asn)/glutamyl-tRNA(Gln) amidotransferase subunit A